VAFGRRIPRLIGKRYELKLDVPSLDCWFRLGVIEQKGREPMRGRRYQPINLSIRLRLEFDFLTVAEFSNTLAIYQRMLRAAWRDTLNDHAVTESPAFRLVVTRASSSSPLEVWVNYILPTVYFSSAIAGPLKDWPGFVKAIFAYLRGLWSAIGKDPANLPSDHIVITGGSVPSLNIPVSALHNRKTAQHIKELWSVAHSGRINLSIKIEGTDESIDYKTE
jgi:hypothetical protein